MAEAKILKPPFKWDNQKSGLQENQQYRRWTEEQVRAMKNGTYDWSKHEEVRVNG